VEGSFIFHGVLMPLYMQQDQWNLWIQSRLRHTLAVEVGKRTVTVPKRLVAFSKRAVDVDKLNSPRLELASVPQKGRTQH
jgi:hypothetical protein